MREVAKKLGIEQDMLRRAVNVGFSDGAFEMKGAHLHDVSTAIDRSGVAVRAGTHCVMPLLAGYGVTATCRASFAMYKPRAEVDILTQVLVKAQEFFT